MENFIFVQCWMKSNFMSYFVKPIYLAHGTQERSVSQFFNTRSAKTGVSLSLKSFATYIYDLI